MSPVEKREAQASAAPQAAALRAQPRHQAATTTSTVSAAATHASASKAE